ncbi:diguanylate cyclase [Pseudidiomarina sp. YC-516-91]|uniref:GGDEF domain-containing protein n=1 Tax=Pseudidiomarina salilacus TaxID=3384452 RepID=UPI003984FEC4
MHTKPLHLFASSSFRYFALICLWLLVWWAARLLEYQPYISLWYPPAGLSLATFILIGRRGFLPILAATLCAGMWMYLDQSQPPPLVTQLTNSLILGSAHTFAYAIGGFYFRAAIGKWELHQAPQRVLSFLSIIILTTLLGTWSGLTGFYLIGGMSLDNIASSWLLWWIGDLAGALVLTPFFILVLSRIWDYDSSWLRPLTVKRSYTPLWQHLWHRKLFIMVAIVGLVITSDYYYNHPAVAYFIFFVSLPQMWIVFTESLERTLVSLAVISLVIALWFGFYGVDEHALTYQFALCVIAANAYFGLSVPSLLQQNRDLEQQTRIDNLTQVASRGHFFKLAERQLQGRRESDFPLALVVFDLDAFKAINDHYGHLVGDQALVLAAQTIRALIRQGDLLGRFGGDEFLILLHDQDLKQAHDTVERLRQSLPAVATPKGSVQLYASFGIVQINHNETLQEALQRADAALLEAKRKGRNQVVS